MAEPPDEAMSTPDVESFDDWYRSIEASPRWDPFMQEALGLPPDVRSTGGAEEDAVSVGSASRGAWVL